MERLETRLRAFAERHGVPLSPEQIRRLDRLDQMVAEWSRALDLSGFPDPEQRVRRYLLEPLDASRFVPEGTGAALDVGTGGGSPGLPLAVLRPGHRWTLLEPNGRRAVFLEEALTQLGLEGARVERSRLQDFAPKGGFAIITSRGVSLDETSLKRMSRWLEPGGRLLLFTGHARSNVLLGWRGILREKTQVALAPDLKAWLVVLEKPLETTARSPDSPDGEDPAGGSGT